MYLIYEPHTRFIGTVGTQQKRVSESREMHFMIQLLSVKGNDCWTFFSIIHNIIHRGQKFDIAWKQQHRHTETDICSWWGILSVLFWVFFTSSKSFFIKEASFLPTDSAGAISTRSFAAEDVLSASFQCLHGKEWGEIWSKWRHE